MLEKFKENVQYKFSKSVYQKNMGCTDAQCDARVWVNLCDGKEVEVASDGRGRIDIYSILPWWCEEVPKLDTLKPDTLKPDTLKPCPFCGGEAEYRGECEMTKVRCSSCEAQTIYWFDEPEDAAEEWNRRVNNV